ncbi:glycoside hydrolase [Exidia glandulosa HHB12029]|uniref:glucan endo-1,3-beta-D-glucosidase n=1 Tax=Exidia glandulosa HHB12029 TaxID=1314781 RepID=A0A165Q0S1_EXIGL|nr:glycoside hydrolase [Exidia glandulosa HHB12029]
MSFDCDDIFAPISCEEPPSIFPRRHEHPVPRKGLVGHPQTTPIPTNKFYANLFLGGRTEGVWCQPYRLSHTNAPTFGMGVRHIGDQDKVLGPDPAAERVNWYYNVNPHPGSDCINISARELSRNMSVDDTAAMSVQVALHAHCEGSVRFPLVQGMGFVTAVYDNFTPAISSSVGFKAVTYERLSKAGRTMLKARITLADASIWLLYALPSSSAEDHTLHLHKHDLHRIEASTRFSGIIQVARCPSSACEGLYDGCAGVYVEYVRISGSLAGTRGRYTFHFQRGGGVQDAELLMFALPHHVSSFDDTTREGVQRYFQMSSTTKGAMTAVLGNSWTMYEPDCPVHLAADFMDTTAPHHIADTMRRKIVHAATTEVGQDMQAATNLDSMYFSGKAMDKYAQLLYTVAKYGNDKQLTEVCSDKLKAACRRFASNQQRFPLVYETAWKGLVSSGAFETGDLMTDFGNSCYNDHHFHASYIIHAAAVIALVSGGPEWIEESRPFVDSLIRDAANPSEDDPFFPVSRAFDWYNGHSWAKGLFESWDGKDQESTSEDVHFAYAALLWGAVQPERGPALAARSALMLAVLRRSFNTYFYMRATNRHHPAQFVSNRITGILFENKVDHTTYFGSNIEYIHGIHMLPVTPASAWARDKEWCEEEWETWFSGGRADAVQGGWRGVLYGSMIAWNPRRAAWWWFQDNFDWGWLDGGMSLAYCRALAAEALGRTS